MVSRGSVVTLWLAGLVAAAWLSMDRTLRGTFLLSSLLSVYGNPLRPQVPESPDTLPQLKTGSSLHLLRL